MFFSQVCLFPRILASHSIFTGPVKKPFDKFTQMWFEEISNLVIDQITEYSLFEAVYATRLQSISPTFVHVTPEPLILFKCQVVREPVMPQP